MKGPDGDSIVKALSQTNSSSLCNIGRLGEYEDEISDEGTIYFQSSSIFTVIVRGLDIAFMEKYTYELEGETPSYELQTPLTLKVGANGIENLELKQIMDEFRPKASKSYVFPGIASAKKNSINESGKYYVFNLIKDHEAIHKIICYMRSNIPRIHNIR